MQELLSQFGNSESWQQAALLFKSISPDHSNLAGVLVLFSAFTWLRLLQYVENWEKHVHFCISTMFESCLNHVSYDLMNCFAFVFHSHPLTVQDDYIDLDQAGGSPEDDSDDEEDDGDGGTAPRMALPVESGAPSSTREQELLQRIAALKAEKKAAQQRPIVFPALKCENLDPPGGPKKSPVKVQSFNEMDISLSPERKGEIADRERQKFWSETQRTPASNIVEVLFLLLCFLLGF